MNPKSVVRKIEYWYLPFPLSEQDREDLEQEAAIILWQLENRFPDDPDRSRAYAYGAAVKETLKYFNRVLSGNNPNPTRLVDIDNLELSPLDNDKNLDPEIIMSLIKIFIDARQKHGERGVNAAKRDAAIVALVYAGFSNEQIANIFQTSAQNIKTYRQRIRKILEKVVIGD